MFESLSHFAAQTSGRFWLGRSLLAIVVLSLTLLVATPSNAQTSGEYTVGLSKSAGIVDGEVIDITVSTPAESVPAGSVYALIALCRPNPNITSYDLQSIQDVAGNCVYNSGSMGSSDFAVPGAIKDPEIGSQLRARGQAVIPWAMGTGVAEWSSAGQSFSLACGVAHPCTMVVLVGAGTAFSSSIFPITFADNSAASTCGSGTAPVSGSHPFRLGPLWSAETVAACSLPGAQGAPTASAANGEDENLRSFLDGTDDLTFTGVGYHDPSLLDGKALRPAVAVPIAINASVLAFSGGTINEAGRKVPFAPLRVTTEEFAEILSGGMSYMGFFQAGPGTPKRWQPLLDRNPDFAAAQQLAGAPFYSNYSDGAQGQIYFPMILGNGDAGTWAATNHLAAVLGDGWHSYPSPVVDLPPCPPGQAGPTCSSKRGTILAAAQAEPRFDFTGTINGTPAMRKQMLVSGNPRSLAPSASTSVVTDVATANWLGITPAAITSAPGGSTFVAPTPASMAAAVPGMTKDENGMRFADPTKIPAGAYPMTFVEYALVPVTPKSDAVTCTLRSWLTFLTTGGQQHLGGGVAPLTPELQADAVEAIAKVGAGTTCTGDPAPPPPVPAPIVPGGLGGSSSYGSTGSPSSAGGSSGRSSASGSVGLESAGDEVAGGPTTPASTEPPIGVVVPDYAGSRTAGALAAVAAMALLGLLTWFAAMFSARKFPWQQAAEDETPEGPQVFAVSGSSPLDIIELD